MRNFFVNSISNDLFGAFSVLFMLLTDAGKKAGIQYAHTIELSRRFLGDAFGIFYGDVYVHIKRPKV